MNPKTVSAAESYFYSHDYWLRFRDDKQEKRGRRKRGRTEEEEQSDENLTTHSEFNQEKIRLKRHRPHLKRTVLKGRFFSMDSDENLLNIFLLLLMTSHLPLVNMTGFYSFSFVFIYSRKKFCSFHSHCFFYCVML